MALAKQYSSVPTNKVFAGTPVAALVSSAWSEIAVGLGIDALAGPGVAALVGFVAALAVAWFVPDAPNIPMESEQSPVKPAATEVVTVPAQPRADGPGVV